MSNGYVPDFKLDLMHLNVLALSTEADCLIVLEELKEATWQIDKDIASGIKDSEWEESAKICRDRFDSKARLVAVKLGDIRERAAKKAKKEEEFNKRHESSGGYSPVVQYALTFRRVAETVLAKEEYLRIEKLVNHLVSKDNFVNQIKQKEEKE